MSALVANTVREALRRRSLQVTLVVSALFMLGLAALGHRWAVTHAEELSRFSTWAAMRYISFFAALLTTFAAMGLVPAELEGRTVSMLITKPLGRWQFVVVKFLAAEVMVAANILVLALVTLVTALWWRVAPDPAVPRNLAMLFVGLSTLAATIVALSVITSAPSAAILGLGWYGLAKWPGVVTQLAASSPPPLSWLLQGIHFLLPDLAKLNFEAPLFQVPANQVREGLVSAAVAIAFWLAVGILAFRRKEL